jgi:hypothetical protein
LEIRVLGTSFVEISDNNNINLLFYVNFDIFNRKIITFDGTRKTDLGSSLLFIITRSLQ